MRGRWKWQEVRKPQDRAAESPAPAPASAPPQRKALGQDALVTIVIESSEGVQRLRTRLRNYLGNTFPAQRKGEGLEHQLALGFEDAFGINSKLIKFERLEE